MQAPGCPPRPRAAVPGTLQPSREKAGGPGDRQGHPRGQGPGEAADADVGPDLGPVVSPAASRIVVSSSRAARPTGHSAAIRGCRGTTGRMPAPRPLPGPARRGTGSRRPRPGRQRRASRPLGAGRPSTSRRSAKAAPDVGEARLRRRAPLGAARGGARRARGHRTSAGPAALVRFPAGGGRLRALRIDGEGGADVGEAVAVAPEPRTRAFGDRGEQSLQFARSARRRGAAGSGPPGRGPAGLRLSSRPGPGRGGRGCSSLGAAVPAVRRLVSSGIDGSASSCWPVRCAAGLRAGLSCLGCGAGLCGGPGGLWVTALLVALSPLVTRGLRSSPGVR